MRSYDQAKNVADQYTTVTSNSVTSNSVTSNSVTSNTVMSNFSKETEKSSSRNLYVRSLPPRDDLASRNTEISRLQTEKAELEARLEDAERFFTASSPNEQVRELIERCSLLTKEKNDCYRQLNQNKQAAEGLFKELSEMRTRVQGMDFSLADKYNLERNRNSQLSMEVEKWKNRYSQLDTQRVEDIDSMKRSRFERPVEGRVEYSSRDNTEMQDRVKEMRKQLDQREKELRKLSNYCEQAEIGLKEEASRAAKYEEQVSSYQEKFALLSQENWRLNDLVGKLRTQVTEKNTRITQLQIFEKSIPEHATDIHRLREMMESRYNELLQIKAMVQGNEGRQSQQCIRLQEALNHMEMAFNQKSLRCQQFQTQIHTMMEESLAYEQQIRAITSDIEQLQINSREALRIKDFEIEDLKNRYEEEVKHIERQNNEAVTTIKSMRQINDKEKSKLEFRLDALEKNLSAVRNDLETKESYFRDYVQQHEELRQAYNQIEAKLGMFVERFTNTEAIEKAFIVSVHNYKFQEDHTESSDIFDHSALKEAASFMTEGHIPSPSNLRQIKNIHVNIQDIPIFFLPTENQGLQSNGTFAKQVQNINSPINALLTPQDSFQQHTFFEQSRTANMNGGNSVYSNQIGVSPYMNTSIIYQNNLSSGQISQFASNQTIAGPSIIVRQNNERNNVRQQQQGDFVSQSRMPFISPPSEAFPKSEENRENRASSPNIIRRQPVRQRNSSQKIQQGNEGNRFASNERQAGQFFGESRQIIQQARKQSSQQGGQQQQMSQQGQQMGQQLIQQGGPQLLQQGGMQGFQQISQGIQPGVQQIISGKLIQETPQLYFQENDNQVIYYQQQQVFSPREASREGVSPMRRNNSLQGGRTFQSIQGQTCFRPGQNSTSSTNQNNSMNRYNLPHMPLQQTQLVPTHQLQIPVPQQTQKVQKVIESEQMRQSRKQIGIEMLTNSRVKGGRSNGKGSREV